MVTLLIALQIWCLSKVRTRPAGRKGGFGNLDKTAIQLGLSHHYHAMCRNYQSCRVRLGFLQKWESMPRLRKK